MSVYRLQRIDWPFVESYLSFTPVGLSYSRVIVFFSAFASAEQPKECSFHLSDMFIGCPANCRPMTGLFSLGRDSSGPKLGLTGQVELTFFWSPTGGLTKIPNKEKHFVFE